MASGDKRELIALHDAFDYSFRKHSLSRELFVSLLAGFDNGWDVVPISPVASRGKRPGKHPAAYNLGFWHEPYRWMSRAFTRAELSDCEKRGAGTGLRFRSRKYFALDVDIDDPDLATLAFDHIRKFENGAFENGLLRIGKAPRFLLLYGFEAEDDRLADTRLEWVKFDSSTFAIDVFSGAGQIVLQGIHPVTLTPYRCFKLSGKVKTAIEPLQMRPEQLLHPVTQAQVDRLIEWLPSMLSEHEPSIRNLTVGTRMRRGQVVGLRTTWRFLISAAIHFLAR